MGEINDRHNTLIYFKSSLWKRLFRYHFVKILHHYVFGIEVAIRPHPLNHFVHGQKQVPIVPNDTHRY